MTSEWRWRCLGKKYQTLGIRNVEAAALLFWRGIWFQGHVLSTEEACRNPHHRNQPQERRGEVERRSERCGCCPFFFSSGSDRLAYHCGIGRETVLLYIIWLPSTYQLCKGEISTWLPILKLAKRLLVWLSPSLNYLYTKKSNLMAASCLYIIGWILSSTINRATDIYFFTCP